jgi:cytosine/adenosine deaminase-related metal-dependent hydrolase
MNSAILKFTADYVHDGSRIRTHTAVITDGRGKVLDVTSLEDAGDGVRVFQGLLCPGFVNAHCHLELSHLKGRLAEGGGLVDFLIGVMQNRNEDAEQLQTAMEAADRRMAEDGIVAVGDISNTAGSLQVKKNSGIHYHTFVETIGFAEASAHRRLEASLRTLGEFREAGLPASLAPHAPYSVSAALFRLIDEHDPAAPLSIHNQECAAEDRLFVEGEGDFFRLYKTAGLDWGDFRPTGKSSLQSWLPYFQRGRSLILVHNTFTKDSDIAFAEKAGYHLHWCLCPQANLYIEGRMPPVALLRGHKASIVLGTDSLASNHALSVLREIRTLQRHFPELTLEEMLRWATRNGAAALGCSARFGSFEKGRRPGILRLAVSKDAAGDLKLTERGRPERLI